MKDKTIAAILAIFLGGVGIHHFYLGNRSKGVLYLVFCWTFIPAIIAFVEGILFLLQSQEEFDAKYNNGQASQPLGVYKTNSASSLGNTAEDLEKLYTLKEKGIITAQEFEAKKKQMLKI